MHIGQNNGLVIDKKKYKEKQTEMMYSKVGQKDNDGKERDRERKREGETSTKQLQLRIYGQRLLLHNTM